jgi:xylulokinase
MFLGIDLGTSSIKAIVIDDDGNNIFESNQVLSISYPKPLWAEQDPFEWVEAAECAILKIPKKFAPRSKVLVYQVKCMEQY